jgi:ATP-dependent RNA helicase SUPV3L1/SUV3
VWNRKDAPPPAPAPGLTSFAVDTDADEAALHAGGFTVAGDRAIRFDMLERLEDELEKALSAGTDAETLLIRLVSLLGSGKDEARTVLTALGWREIAVEGAKPVWRRAKQRPQHAARAKRKEEPPPNPNSPFASLAALRMR